MIGKYKYHDFRNPLDKQECVSLEEYLYFPPFNPPKSRACKILMFKHYQTDAPI